MSGSLEISRFDGGTASADIVAQWYAVFRACHVQAAPREPVRSAHEMLGWFQHPPGDEQRLLWLGRDCGSVVAVASLAARSDGFAVVDVKVLSEARQLGHGTLLLNAVATAARELQVRTLSGLAMDAGSVAFCEHRGWRRGRELVRQVLDLQAREPVAADGPVTTSSFTSTTWIGAAPPALLTSFATARNAINDAPGEAAEDEVWTPAHVRDHEAAAAARGVESHVTVLLDGSTVVGFTEIRVSTTRGAVATTEDTALVASYRGRGLAHLLKQMSLRALATARPDVGSLTTTNDAGNQGILAVNRRLGFAPVATRTRMWSELAASE